MGKLPSVENTLNQLVLTKRHFVGEWYKDRIVIDVDPSLVLDLDMSSVEVFALSKGSIGYATTLITKKSTPEDSIPCISLRNDIYNVHVCNSTRPPCPEDDSTTCTVPASRHPACLSVYDANNASTGMQYCAPTEREAATAFLYRKQEDDANVCSICPVTNRKNADDILTQMCTLCPTV